MPFQVTLQKFVLQADPILLVSAGEIEFYICDTGVRSITLTPTMIGPLPGHTFEWELISFGGDPLLPLPNMTVGSIFPVSAPGTFMYDLQFGVMPLFTTVFSTDDMVWRFYVDRGTPQEQFKDVTIFFTPTSFLAPSFIPPATAFSPLKTVSTSLVAGKGRTMTFGSNENRKVTNLRPDGLIPTTPTVLGGKLTDKLLTWTYSANTDQFIDLTIFENLAGTFNQIAVITDPDVRFYSPAIFGGSYKALVRQNDGDIFGNSDFITTEQLGPILINAEPIFLNYAPIVPSLITNQSRGQTQILNYDVIERSIKLLDNVTQLSVTLTNKNPQNNSIRVDGYDVFLVTLKIAGPYVTQFSVTLTNQNPQNTSVAVNNFAVVDLDGGAIGGG